MSRALLATAFPLAAREPERVRAMARAMAARIELEEPRNMGCVRA